MTIIYSNMGDVDCSLLPLMWRGLPNARTIEITPRSVDWESQVHAALVAETDTLILTGHGTQYGLLFPDFQKGDYIIHENNVDDIMARNVFCCWCNASEFCAERHLSAVATSMFISNVDEAYNCGYCEYDQSDINAVCTDFYKEINGLLSRRVPLPQWVQSLQHYTNGIDVFNRRGVMDFTA